MAPATKTDFAARLKEAEDAGYISNSEGFYKYKEGDNRLRLMSECLPHQSDFKGQKSFKWLCYVLDRRDGKIKPHFMPHKIYKAITALQNSEDYAFNDVPMPYDLTVHAKGAGTKEVEYTLMPARKETALTLAEANELDRLKPLAEIKQALKDKQEKTAPPAHDDGDPGYSDDDQNVPF